MVAPGMLKAAAPGEAKLFCRVDRGDRIVGVGGYWDQFAFENDGLAVVADRVLGTNLLDHVHGDAARMLVFTLLSHARRIGRPRTVPYRCDSPDFRRFMEMTVSPEPQGGVLFAYRLLRSEARLRPLRFAVPGTPTVPVRIRCSSCNRIRDGGHWREPEAAASEPIMVAYGVCDECRLRVQRLLGG